MKGVVLLPRGLIRAIDLVDVLKIHETTLYDWDESDFLKPVTGYAQKYYATETVDAWLAAQSRNFQAPPTFDDLMSGRVVLLLAGSVAEQLSVTVGWLGKLVETKRLAAISFRREYRYSAESVAARAALKSDEETVTYISAEHILGVSRPITRRLVQSGRLASAEGDPYRRRVTRESLLALLSDQLDFVDPRDWIDDRLSTRRPLLAVHTVAYNGADMPRVASLVRAGQLYAVRHATTGRPLISPDSVLAYIERTEEPLTFVQIAHIFGVSKIKLRDWRRTGILVCSTHEHYDDTFYKPCILATLGEWLTPSSSPIAWYKARLERPETIVGVEYAQRALRMSRAEVMMLTKVGKLHGLHLPSGGWRFTSNAVERTRRMLGGRRAAQ